MTKKCHILEVKEPAPDLCLGQDSEQGHLLALAGRVPQPVLMELSPCHASLGSAVLISSQHFLF